jgi:hypothetical protein
MFLYVHTKKTMQRTAKQKRGRNGSKWPGICSWAQQLGVHRNTVLKVLKGEWKSKTLTARLKQLRGMPLTTADALLIGDYNRRTAARRVVFQAAQRIPELGRALSVLCAGNLEIPNADRDAKRLGVASDHLAAVLSGRTQDATLLRRYDALLGTEAKTKTKRTRKT